MKIDFSQPIIDLNGKPALDGVGEDAKPWTLGLVSSTALVAVSKENAAEDGAKKTAATILAMRVHGGGEVELSVPEAKMLIDKIGRLPWPLIVGRALMLIDPPAKP